MSEGYGSAVRCARCDTKLNTRPPIASASPIVVAFSRTKPTLRITTNASSTEECKEGPVDERSEESKQEAAIESETSQVPSNTPKRTRATQIVNTIAERIRVVIRMKALEAEGEKFFKSKVVAEHPDLFTGNYKSNVQKTSELWSQCDSIHDSTQSSGSVRVDEGVKRVQLKVAKGREKKDSMD